MRCPRCKAGRVPSNDRFCVACGSRILDTRTHNVSGRPGIAKACPEHHRVEVGDIRGSVHYSDPCVTTDGHAVIIDHRRGAVIIGHVKDVGMMKWDLDGNVLDGDPNRKLINVPE